MSKRGIEMTMAQAVAHQQRHGFGSAIRILTPAERNLEETVKPRGSKQPNKTEAEFGRRLAVQFRVEPTFEAFKIRVGGNCYYTPDWVIWMDGRLWFFEVKGAHAWDDSIVKFKAAKERYPHMEFEMWQKKKGEWRRLH